MQGKHLCLCGALVHHSSHYLGSPGVLILAPVEVVNKNVCSVNVRSILCLCVLGFFFFGEGGEGVGGQIYVT